MLYRNVEAITMRRCMRILNAGEIQSRCCN